MRRALSAKFRAAGIDSAALDAKLLILAVTGWSATDLILRADETLLPADVDALDGCASRRLSGEPIDHILGYRDFYGRRFHISKDVLSPRQETEALVALVLSLSANLKKPNFLDLGTGSGAIAISLLAEREGATCVAVDISEAALTVTKGNASLHGVQDRLILTCGSWFESVTGQFDVIVSNPPYITDAAMSALPTEVSSFDPDIALRGGKDGLAPYRVITGQAAKHLKSGGWLAFEIGYDQGFSVSRILRDNFFNGVQIQQDLSGHDRIVYGQKPLENKSK